MKTKRFNITGLKTDKKVKAKKPIKGDYTLRPEIARELKEDAKTRKGDRVFNSGKEAVAFLRSCVKS